MDLVQDQVDVLNNKVDALQHTIEQFKTNLAEVLGELKSITPIEEICITLVMVSAVGTIPTRVAPALIVK
ncbi:MAG: hypothetical protein HC769_09340 [Cyanobacteria bacterium CRU_2_1]|nr:hypothetical protein [Cyanobacteria bacterium CRU_2_1]